MTVPNPDLVNDTLEPAIRPLIVLEEDSEELLTDKLPVLANAMSVAFKISVVIDKFDSGWLAPTLDEKVTVLLPPVAVVMLKS